MTLFINTHHHREILTVEYSTEFILYKIYIADVVYTLPLIINTTDYSYIHGQVIVWYL